MGFYIGALLFVGMTLACAFTVPVVVYYASQCRHGGERSAGLGI